MFKKVYVSFLIITFSVCMSQTIVEAASMSEKRLIHKKTMKLFEDKKYQDAIDFLLVEADKTPTDTDVLMMLSHAYKFLGEDSKAKEYLEKVLTIDPRIEIAYIGLALMADKFEEKERLLTTAINNSVDLPLAAFSVLLSNYVAEALEFKHIDNFDPAKPLKLLDKAEQLVFDYIKRIEETPDEYFKNMLEREREGLTEKELKDYIDFYNKENLLKVGKRRLDMIQEQKEVINSLESSF